MTAIQFLKSHSQDYPQTALEELVSHHLLIVGQTGSGKTTTTLALLNDLQKTAASAIILDPTGEYSTLPNSQHYTFGENCYLDAGRWGGRRLLDVLDISHNDFQAELVDRAIQSLRIELNIYCHRHTYQKIGRPVSDFVDDVKRLGPWAKSYPITLLPDQLVEEMVAPFEDQRANYHLLGQQYDRQLIAQQWQLVTALRERLA